MSFFCLSSLFYMRIEGICRLSLGHVSAIPIIFRDCVAECCIGGESAFEIAVLLSSAPRHTNPRPKCSTLHGGPFAGNCRSLPHFKNNVYQIALVVWLQFCARIRFFLS